MPEYVCAVQRSGPPPPLRPRSPSEQEQANETYPRQSKVSEWVRTLSVLAFAILPVVLSCLPRLCPAPMHASLSLRCSSCACLSIFIALHMNCRQVRG